MKSLTLSLMLALVVLAGCTEDQQFTPTLFNQQTKAQSLQPQALTILKSGLNHDNAYIRNHSVEIVAVTGCRKLMPDLLSRLKDSSIAVRFSAASAIGDMQCFGYEKQVRSLLNDSNENVQIAAAYALVRLNQLKYHEKIRQAARSADQTVRANAVLLLGKLKNRDDLNLLYEILNDPASLDKVRLQVVESIAQLGDGRIYRSKLWALLISKYADDRVMGIRGMGALGSAEAKNAILTMLQDDIQEVRLAAAEQLGRLGDDRGQEEILRYFQSNPDLNNVNMANNMAVMAIGRIGSKRLQSYLPAALSSQSDYIRLLGAQSVLLLAQEI